MHFFPPEPNPEQRKKLHAVIRANKVRSLHALIKKGVYIDASAFDLAKQFMPEQVPTLIKHQLKTFYDHG